MTAIGWLQILVFFAAIVAVTRPLGVFMFRVFEGERPPFAWDDPRFKVAR